MITFSNMMYGIFRLLINSSNFKIILRAIKIKGKIFFFRINNKNLNLEFKYIFLKLLVKEDWSLSSLFNSGAVKLNKVTEFFNEAYPDLNSLLDCDINILEKDWFKWLTKNNIPIKNSHQQLFLVNMNIKVF